jgi:hypothetical protein
MDEKYSKSTTEIASRSTLRTHFDKPPQPSSEQSKEIEQSVMAVSEMLQAFPHPWYVGGGLALDLMNETLTRNHDDIDITIPEEAIGTIWEYARESNWSFWTHEGEQLATAEAFASQINIGIEGIVIQSDGTNMCEIMCIKRTDASGTLRGPAGISLPPEAYDTCPHKILSKDRQVLLTPPEIVLLHKLLDGRHKDLLDVFQYLPQLSDAERARFDTYLNEINPTFEIRGETISDIEALISIAVAENTTVFDENIAQITEQEQNTLNEQDYRTAEILLTLATNFDRDSFLAAATETFGEARVKKYQDELQKVEAYVYSGEEISTSQLSDFIYSVFNRKLYLEQRIAARMQLLNRWDTKVSPRSITSEQSG